MKRLMARLHHALPYAVLVLLSGLTSACATVELSATKPTLPEGLSAAKQYMDVRSDQVNALQAELDQKMRECYTRFFVSDCIDAVRAKSAEYRRAHVEAETAANDMIRLDSYNQRQREKQAPKPESKKVL